MAIKKIISSVDFISQEHEILEFWEKENISINDGSLIRENQSGVLLMVQLPLITLWVSTMLGEER